MKKRTERSRRDVTNTVPRRTVLKGGAAILASSAAGLRPRSARAAVAGRPRKWDLEVDLVSIGASCGGLVAAVVGHDLGLRCVVLEKGDLVGGGTAVSGGLLWIPNNHHQRAEGWPDSREAAIDYVRSTSYGRHDEAKLAAYVDLAPEMLRYLNGHTPAHTVPTRDIDYLGGDYYAHVPGSRYGRLIDVDREYVKQLVTQRMATEPILAKLRVSRWRGGVQTGIIGALTLACLDRKIPLLASTPGKRLVEEHGRVIGVHTQHEGRDFFVKANRGVVIATGGFEWNRQLAGQFLAVPAPLVPVTPPVNEGDGLIMGMELGAALALMDCGIWLPALMTPGDNWGGTNYGDLEAQHYAFEKPGEILVNRSGIRCCDEAFYPGPPRAAFAPPAAKESEYPNTPMFWIADQAYRDRFDIGPLPKGTAMRPWIYRANTLRELAAQLGINPDTLEATVKRYNAAARQGHDPDFGRAEYQPNEHVRAVVARIKEKMAAAGEHPDEYRAVTTATKRGNCPGIIAEVNMPDRLGTIEKPPFYAAKVGVATVGTRGGLLTNASAQVLHIRGDVIPGLYATSNAAANTAIGAGYTSGQAHSQSGVFGYVAAKHMAGKAHQALA